MPQDPVLISRRSFLGKSVLMGAQLSLSGLLLGFRSKATKVQSLQSDSTGISPNVFVHIAPTGIVTIICNRSEMGQGIRSSIPVLIADELGAEMKYVKIVQADGDSIYGDQNTDGSNSIRGFYDDIRQTAATARVMLISAASRKWNVPPSNCIAEMHVVKNTIGGEKLGFGALAVLASKMQIARKSEVTLRPLSELKNVGRKLPLLDGPAYVTGAAVFGADVRLPGMLIALIARPPAVGSTVESFDAKETLAIAGVKNVFQMPTPNFPYAFQPWGGVAVLAENTWSAQKGRNALKIKWKNEKNQNYDSKKFKEQLIAAVQLPGKIFRNKGDVDAALLSSERQVNAEYYVPHLPHVSMEPPVAIAHFEKDFCEIWAPTQNPQAARAQAATTLGIPESNVTVHVTFLGGAFGRKSKADFVAEAAFLAKKSGFPVRVQWTREDDIQHDFYNTVSGQKLTAAIDKTGKITAWRHRTAFPPISSLFKNQDQPDASDLQQGVLDLPLAITNVRAEACAAKAYVRIGWLRSVYNIFHSFAINSFIDEIARELGRDTRETMLEIFGHGKDMSLSELGLQKLENYGASLEKYPIDVSRLRRVIETATLNANWNNRFQNKRALGLAAHHSFLSYTAVVASVKKDIQGKIKVDEVWLAFDAGTIINPDRVRAQMEGSVLFGMSLALYDALTMRDGITLQSNFDSFRVARMSDAPTKIHVEIISSTSPPGGVGEPGVPPVAPAIGNAIFALTGKRQRELPFLTSDSNSH